ncbi:rRNA maturation RNase YbeY [Nostoc sp. CHAB 5844]|nr:rRNA maturation RNase YbeY [Nostoc sp. CHAB 5844]
MQVELNLQDVFSESSPQLAANVGGETWENWFHHWLENLQPHLPPAPSYEIGLRLTNDAEIQSLNAQYRHQDKPTDVLAFAALETDFPHYAELLDEPLYLGDIVISVNTAQRQAQQQGHSLVTELAWLASHGLLHLLGWDHPDDESLIKMLKQQVKILEAVSIHIDIEY